MDKQETLKYISTVVRALITSRKPPITLREVLRDYNDVEGCPLPYQKLGYSTAQEMLMDTQDFNFQMFDNQVCVTAKYNAKTEHIVSMVRGQKRGKPKTSRSFGGSTGRSFYGYGGSGSSYSHRNSSNCNYGSHASQSYVSHASHSSPSSYQSSYSSQSNIKSSSTSNTNNNNSSNEIERLRQQLEKELVAVRQQQAEQIRLQREFEEKHKRQEQELLQSQKELRFEQETQRKELLKQQTDIEKQLKVLQMEQERGIKEQAREIKKLKEERVLLQQKEALEALHRKQLELEAANAKAKQEEKKRIQLKEQAEAARLTAIQNQNNETLRVTIPNERRKKPQLEITITNELCPSAGVSPRQPSRKIAMNGKEQPKVASPAKKGKGPKDEQQQRKQQRQQNLQSQSQPEKQQRPQQRTQPLLPLPTQQQAPQHKPLIDKPPLRPILGHSAAMHTPSAVNPMTPPITARAVFKRHPHLNAPNDQTLNGNAQRQTSSVNDRLKFKPANNGLMMTPPLTPINVTPLGASLPKYSVEEVNCQLEPTPQKLNLDENSGPYQFDPANDTVISLNQYCVARNFAPPEYRFYNERKTIHCTVSIDSLIFSSYPMGYASEDIAKRKTSEIAIERLHHLESRKHLPICTLTDDEFIDLLYHELIKYPNGIVSRKLPEWYEQTFNHQVPTHWWSLVNGSPKIRLENGLNMIIVYANVVQPQIAIKPIPEEIKIPELKLPWKESQVGVNVSVTHCASTTEVWVRLLGGRFNVDFEQYMSTCMSEEQNRFRPKDIYEEQIYMVETPDGWNRVRTLSVDRENQTCVCHFVDFGDTAVYSCEDLYVCLPEFLALPPQGVCLSMYAMENYEDHPHALAVLNKELANHTLVLKFITMEEDFVAAGGRSDGLLLNGKRQACLIGLFFDTSTSEDVDLNEKISTIIKDSTPWPLLKLEQKSNPVLVSHISDDGDLRVLIPNEDLKFVQRSIAKMMSDRKELPPANSLDLKHDRMFLVCDETTDGTKRWYRGLMITIPKGDEEIFDMYYVDDGRYRATHISNIYSLESINMVLSKYPAQALRVKLHDVPPIDNQMVARLRGLMPPQSEVLLKVMESSSNRLPMVTVHARGQDGLYLCVNSAIRIEYEVHSPSHLQPFDDGGLQFNINGQLIRRNSFSSTVSGSSTNSSEPSAVLGVISPSITPRKRVTLLKEYEAIPAVGAFFEVRVSLSINPNHFAVQPYKLFNKLQSLMKDLQAYCTSGQATKVPPSELACGHPYATQDTSGIYYRVNVYKIYDEMIHVHMVDVGDDVVVRSDQLLYLQPAMLELPMMSIPSQLYGIKLEGVEWTPENCKRFRELTVGQKFVSTVRKVNKLKDGSSVLSLELIDTSTPQDIRLHDILVKEKHAEPAA